MHLQILETTDKEQLACQLGGVKSMNEVYPLDRVAEAYERMMSGKARFRVVLNIGE